MNLRSKEASKMGRATLSVNRTLTLMIIYSSVGLLMTNSVVQASFNLFMDRYEAQKLLGLPSDIYYVREGVVNEYALNFTVKVPATVEHLRFSWQSFSKKPIQYEMVIEYTNFFALLPPLSNISNVGRIPGKLESFRITLPCSGRINAEVAVSIRFKFHMKHLKGDQSVLRGNTTVVNLMRNKICLLQEYVPPPNFDEPPPPPPPPPAQSPPSPAVVVGTKSISQPAEAAALPPLPTLVPSVADKGSNGGGRTTTNSTLLLFQDPTPSLLLAGLLGGCAVTASIVFLIFFICLRRKLVPSSSSSSSRSSPLSSAYSGVGGIINSDPNSSSNNSSPACLLRQSGMGLDPQWTKESCCDSSTFKDKYSNPTSTIGSRNSYVTIASFWNDIFGTHGNSRHCTATTTTTGSPLATHQKRGTGRHSCNSQQHQQQQHQQNNTCRSGQFCSHHCHHPHPHNNYHMNSTFSPTHQPTCSSTNNETSTTKGSDVSPYAYAHIVPKIAPPPPPLIEWYSESTCNNGGHIFSNNLFTFQPVPPSHLNATSGGAHGSSSNSMSAPLPPQVPPKITMGPSESIPIVTNNDGNSSTTTRSTGSGSLIQIDGFQCRKNLIKDGHVVERFL